MKFSEMKYTRFNLDEVVKYIDEMATKLNNAESAKEAIDLIYEFDVFNKELNTNYNLVHIRYTIDTKDEFYETEMNYYDENMPVVSTKKIDISKAIYNSRFKEDIVKEFGSHLFTQLESEIILNEEVIDLLQKQNELVTKYNKKIANSDIKYDGEVYTLTQMSPYLQNTDRNSRKEAYRAVNNYFERNQDFFDNTYDELVKTRDAMAKKLGFENYISLQYKLLQRSDYDHNDVFKYREKVLKYITPLAVELRKKQAQRLGLDELKFYDRALIFPDGNSDPKGDYNFIIDNAKKMYEELSPETGEFFNFMVDNELLDLVAKPGKVGGGYCTTLDKYKSPFIFSNFNGTRGDIDVITHEAGHAFQAYMARNMKLSNYVWPTYEAAEIHSMSMEFLTWPWMELFFKEDADKYRFSALQSSICFIPYGVTIDHFQHYVYENPQATPEERRAKYHELELMYEPDKNYDDDFLNSGGYWFKQGHVFSTPFYYIDYTLAQVCAFQYFIKSVENREKAFEDYLTLCKAGGSQSFFRLMEIGKIENPMTTDVLREIVPKLVEKLDELEKKINA